MEPIVLNRLALGPSQRVEDNTFHLLLCERRNRSRITKFLCRLRCASRRRTPSSRSLVLRATETENREENDSQKSETESEAHAFAEAFGQINTENYTDYKIHERDEH